MSRVEQLEQDIMSLSASEFATLRDWFQSYLVDEWDRQIEADAEAGKLDHLTREALAEHSKSDLPDRWPYSFHNNRYVLELAERYDDGRMYHSFDPQDCKRLSFVGSRVQTLERDGYIVVRYSDREFDGRKLKQIDSMVLTAKGEKELIELRSKDPIRSLATRIHNLGWVVVTSIITSIITVWVLGAIGQGP